MMNTSTCIITKLASYEAIYASYEPQNKRALAYRAHNLVYSLIKAQFVSVFYLSDLVLLNDEMDAFIRELKSEYDLINVDLGEFDYPNFVKGLQGMKYSGPLGTYHSLVIDTLKIILFRINTSNSQGQIEKKLFSLIKENVNHLKPTSDNKILFNDRSDKSIKKIHTDMDIEEYIKRQIDISLDS